MIGSVSCHGCGHLTPVTSIDSRCVHCGGLAFAEPGLSRTAAIHDPPTPPRVVGELPPEKLTAAEWFDRGMPLASKERLASLQAKAEQPYPPGDPLGRVYTPPSLAYAHAQHVAVFFGCRPQVVLEPSVGRGDYLSSIRGVWPLARVLAVDIDKGAQGIKAGPDGLMHQPDCGLCADFITAAHFWERLPPGKSYGYPDMILGNPPFGKEVGLQLTIDFVLASLELAKHQKGLVSFLLPLPYLCGQEFDEVWKVRRPRCIGRVKARPWPDRLREVCTMTWDMDGRDDDTSLVDIDWPREEA